ncbi:MAG: flagellar biosynthesis protein FlhB [Burkholderiales bacterium]|nr:flagellar biosynthesis protein FlhB [Burkholderiales bacterium]
MSDSAQDRNLPASERKKRRAREDGQVPRSRDLGHVAALGGGGAALLAAAGPLATWLRDLLSGALRFGVQEVHNPAAMGEQLQRLGGQALLLVLPLGALVGLAAMLAAKLSGGWNVSFKALRPDFSRFDPLAGLGRMVSKQHLLNVLMTITLAVVVGVVGTLYIRSRFFDLAGLLAVPLPQAISEIGGVLAACMGLMLLALAGWAAIDVPLQRHLWLNRLKMTREEAKQEMKDAEGNLEVKARIKARMREMSRKRMLAAVPEADLVVMNPTHYAVALKYDEARMGAPRVVAKGADLLALRIRDLARDAQVPVLQAPPLARALYAHCELDQEVPAALFAAVAQVLAWVYQLRRSPELASAPPQVQVPQGLDPHEARA